MVQYFKDENNKSKKRYRIYKTINTKLESVDSIVIIGETSTSITLSITSVGLPISDGIACTLSLGNKVLHKTIIKKYNKYKTQYGKDQQTIKSFDKLYRKSLQDNFIGKTEYENLCNIFTKYLEETKMILFYKFEHKIKINFFCHIKFKFQHGT